MFKMLKLVKPFKGSKLLIYNLIKLADKVKGYSHSLFKGSRNRFGNDLFSFFCVGILL